MSEDDPFYAPSHTPPARQPRPGQHLWTLRKDGGSTRAELRSHGEYGWELQLFRDGTFIYGHRWNLHQSALEEAADHRRAFEREGWELIAPPRTVNT
jgi:hypothetical protein